MAASRIRVMRGALHERQLGDHFIHSPSPSIVPFSADEYRKRRREANGNRTGNRVVAQFLLHDLLKSVNTPMI